MPLKELRLSVLLLAGFPLAAPTLARAGETEKISRTFPIAADNSLQTSALVGVFWGFVVKTG